MLYGLRAFKNFQDLLEKFHANNGKRPKQTYCES